MKRTRSLLVVHSGYPEALNFYMPDNGLANLAACLLDAGHETQIVDFNVPSEAGRLARPDRPSNVLGLIREGRPDALRRLLEADEAHDRDVFRQTGEALAERVVREGIDWVGFKLWSGDSVYASHTIAAAIKKRAPGTRIIAGGPQVDRIQLDLLEACPAFEVASVREGEPCIVPFAEYVAGERALEEVPNLIYRSPDGALVRTKTVRVTDLDALPFPCYDPAIYPAMAEKLRVFPYEEARGCRNRCAFCSHVNKSGYLRAKSCDNIAGELMRLKREAGAVGFRMSSSFTPGELLNALSAEMSARRLNRPWSALGHVHDAEEVDYPAMARAGCVSLFFGVESGSQRILDDVVHKDVRVEDIRAALAAAGAAGLGVIASFIHPCPSEDAESRRATLKLIEDIRPYAVTAYFPGLFPGSRWWREPERYGFAVDRSSYRRSLLHHKMRFSYPMELWQPLDYEVDGKPIETLIAECTAFLGDVQALGVRSGISDDIVLFSRMLGDDPVAFRDRVAAMGVERDAAGTAELIQALNESIGHDAPEGDGGSRE